MVRKEEIQTNQSIVILEREMVNKF